MLLTTNKYLRSVLIFHPCLNSSLRSRRARVLVCVCEPCSGFPYGAASVADLKKQLSPRLLKVPRRQPPFLPLSNLAAHPTAAKFPFLHIAITPVGDPWFREFPESLPVCCCVVCTCGCCFPGSRKTAHTRAGVDFQPDPDQEIAVRAPTHFRSFCIQQPSLQLLSFVWYSLCVELCSGLQS